MKYVLAIIFSLLLISCAEILYEDSNTIHYCINNKCQIRVVHHYESDMTEEYQIQYKISITGDKVCICKY